MENGGSNLRKARHLEACLDDGVDLARDSFGAYRLCYRALPEISLDEVSTGCAFAGRRISAPLLIGPMTGGLGEPFLKINRNLALAAQELGLPLSLGSMRVALESPAARESFMVRSLAPDVPLVSNLGLVSLNHGLSLPAAAELAGEMDADVFGLHLNPLQEVIQQGGDTDFRGLEERLREVLAGVGRPVLVKECGGGIAPPLVARLAALGVDYIDISGADGTSWAAVEARLADDPALGELFADFGLPTAWILEHLGPHQKGSARIIAGGGIRNGLQAVKALALGGHMVSMARPFLQAAMDSADEVIRLGQRFIREMKTAMFLVGARQLEELGPHLFLGADGRDGR
ncbi:MAG: type 2 isopentenyl-diphosphate Delta-isomerase [Deltaproteobacteria bacterium]|nr:type 2 isopentenyl-diphosphate Delta-isomerase [Deltaproteobacteria bacterium]